MAIPFSRSMRSLAADGFRLSGSVLAIAALLVAAWLMWFASAQVTVFEVSEEARVEVITASHSVDAPVNGQILTSYVTLGKHVERGDVLLVLEAETEELKLEEEVTTRQSSQTELEGLRRQIEAQRSALSGMRRGHEIEVEQRQAQYSAAQARLEEAENNLARSRKLFDEKLYSDHELGADVAKEKVERATATSLGLQIQRAREENVALERAKIAEIEGLEQRASQLEGGISRSASTEARLGVELEKRQIKAAISGTLGDVAQHMRPGGFVEAGERLFTIVPSGAKHVVAEFAPSEAFGRIREGQSARLRLDGYSWTQYGTVAAIVNQVGSETRDGRVRVELTIESVPDGIVLEHGLPGELEVEVEAVTPAVLMLRSVGKMVEGA